MHLISFAYFRRLSFDRIIYHTRGVQPDLVGSAIARFVLLKSAETNLQDIWLSSSFCTMPFKCPSMPFQIDFLDDMMLKGMPFQINENYLKGHSKGHALQYHIIQKGNLKGH